MATHRKVEMCVPHAVLDDYEEACGVFLGNMRKSLPGPDPDTVSISTVTESHGMYTVAWRWAVWPTAEVERGSTLDRRQSLN